MPFKKFKTKVKKWWEVSDDMEDINDFLTQLVNELQKIDWVKLFADYPTGGGGTPPPQIPKWPP
jgi:hypothetical protein